MGVQTILEDARCDPQEYDCHCDSGCLAWLFFLVIAVCIIGNFFENR